MNQPRVIITMINCTCFRHVHSGCDPEANEQVILEKRVSQLNYMFVCRICKSGGRSMSTPGTPTSSSALGYNDDSNDANWEDMDDIGSGGGTLSLGRSFCGSGVGGGGGIVGGGGSSGGQGKGKPMAAFPAVGGKRGRRGYFGMGPGSTSVSTSAVSFARSRSYMGGSPYFAASPTCAGTDGPNKPGTGMKKRGGVEVASARRRGRQPKIRGMVGLQVY